MVPKLVMACEDKSYPALGPTVAVLGERERADALTSGGENSVADGRKNGRKRWFAKSRGWIFRAHKMDLDLRWRLRNTDRRIRVKVILHSTATLNRDLVGHQLAEPVDDAALHLIFSVERIDDLASDVARDPDFVNFNLFGGVDANFGDFRKISAVRKVERHAGCGTFRKRTRAPFRFTSDAFEDSAHAGRVEFGLALRGRDCGVRDARSVQKLQAELNRVLPCRVRHFIKKRLEDECVSVAARCAKRIGGNTTRHKRCREQIARHKTGRTLVATK